MDNRMVAAIFYEVADILDLQGVAFKPNAYRRAARSLEDLSEDVSKIAGQGKLEEIPGVGKSFAKKIDEIVRTGRLEYLNRLKSQIPPGLQELLSVPDVGPRKAMMLYKELGISNLEELKRAALEHRLRGVKGFGEKTEERILQGIGTVESKGKRMLLGEACPVAESIVAYLKSKLDIDLISPAGSLRRGRETIGDIDILVGDDKPSLVMEAFVGNPEVDKVLMKGPTKSSVLLKTGLQVDIRVVDAECYGAALQYFTGSKEHNVTMRKMGVERGLKLNEYGVFERDSDKMIACKTEEEVYAAFDLPLIPPEIREDSGEIEAARKGRLPDLVSLADIKGDTHVHTEWSDGSMPIEAVLENSIERGYEFVVISDHSQSLKIANGLSPERLRKQIAAIRKLQERFEGEIAIFAGSEVDIKTDGSLDFPASLLKELDVVVGSVHSKFKMQRGEMTKRVVSAISSGRLDVLGHPTGRIIGERDPYEMDFDEVFYAAKEAGVCMEINSFIDRLDLRDVHCRLAKEAGVVMAIGTDAHRLEQLDFMRYGVTTARRGWLEKKNIVNTLDGNQFRSMLGRRR